MTFEIKAKDPQSSARAGVMTTDHGVIETPIFMPVGTVASVKGVHQRELKDDINPDIILKEFPIYMREESTTEILLAEKYDYVVDCIDTLSPKVFLIKKCFEKGYAIKTQPKLLGLCLV